MIILFWRCSILVRTSNSEDGAKNPLKGTSMKFLVIASDAQSGVVAGSKEPGLLTMACKNLTLNPWRLVLNKITPTIWLQG